MLTYLVKLGHMARLILIFSLSLVLAIEKTNLRNQKKTVNEIGESLRKVELRQCFEQRRLVNDFSSPNLVGQPSGDHLKWCLRVLTDRNGSHAKNMVVQSSWVELSWYRLDDGESKNERRMSIPCLHGGQDGGTVAPCRDVRPSCTLAYDGFRGEYRLSPDFGGYEKCSPTMEEYYFKLHNRTASGQGRKWKSRETYEAPSKRGCPLKRLPFSQDDFQTCTLSPNAWYLLTFRSYARWDSGNGSFLEAKGKDGSQLLRTYEAKDDISMTHTQVNGCLLKTIFLLRHKLPFLLRLKVDVHVKNDANSVRQVHHEDGHDVGMDLVGKEFTYQLPPGTRLVRYCQKAEAILDRDPDYVMAMPNEIHWCVARPVHNCHPQSSNAESIYNDRAIIYSVVFAISVIWQGRAIR